MELKPGPNDGYMKNAKGHLVPEEMVSAIDKLRDQTVMTIVREASKLNEFLIAFKRSAFSDIATFIETSAAEYNVKVGGDKGNVTLYSFDGRFKVTRALQDNIRFDERLQAAKALIDECINEWATGSRSEIKVLVNDSFQVDKEGAVVANRVLGLRRLGIEDEKWKRAMDAISDSVQVVGSTTYVRVYERVGDTDKYEAISLDLASA